jgi:peptide/nickel transport system substrate-binding protein
VPSKRRLFGDVAAPDPDPYARWHGSQGGSSRRQPRELAGPAFDRPAGPGADTGEPLQRKELYGQFQELFAQEVPAIPLYVPTAVYVQTAGAGGGLTWGC